MAPWNRMEEILQSFGW